MSNDFLNIEHSFQSLVHAVVEVGQILRGEETAHPMVTIPQRTISDREIARNRCHRIYHGLEGLTNWGVFGAAQKARDEKKWPQRHL